MISDMAYETLADCTICNKNFHTFRRKHRCKVCGTATCSNCAKTHKLLPRSHLVKSNDLVRVCDTCVDRQRTELRNGQANALNERQRYASIPMSPHTGHVDRSSVPHLPQRHNNDEMTRRQEQRMEEQMAVESKMQEQILEENMRENARVEEQERVRNEARRVSERMAAMKREETTSQRIVQEERSDASDRWNDNGDALHNPYQDDNAHPYGGPIPNPYENTNVDPYTAEEHAYQNETNAHAYENEEHAYHNEDAHNPYGGPIPNPYENTIPNPYETTTSSSSINVDDHAPLYDNEYAQETESNELNSTIEEKPNVVQQLVDADECAICLENMLLGSAIFTTGCGHNFHFNCLKEIQKSDSSNFDKCPACRTIMSEMQMKKRCDHPRVRKMHQFCRDCGEGVTENDAKERIEDRLSTVNLFDDEGTSGGGGSAAGRGNGGSSGRGNGGGSPAAQPPSQSSHPNTQGAIIRCPVCSMQMRVLPHMFNMRVACPAGHQFLVSVSNERGNSSTRNQTQQRRGNGNYPGSNYRRFRQ